MVAYRTFVLTSRGHIPIGTLENQEIEVWNGQEFTKTVVLKTKTQEPLRTLVMDSGATIELSANHLVQVQYKYWDPTLTARPVKDVEFGIRTIKGKFPIIETGTEKFPYAYTHGFYMGAEKYHRQARNVVSRATVFGSRRPSLEYLETTSETDKVNIVFPSDMPDIWDTPLDSKYSLETKLEWLAGLFDGGLVLRKQHPRPIWHMYSYNEEFLKDLKLLFQTLGGDARVIKNQDMNRASYSLRLSGVTMQNLRSMLIPTKTLTIPEIKYNPKKRTYQVPRIADVIDEGVVADTYGFIEPNRRTAVFNGILIGDGYST
jgi:ribonucleoside-diphosphate reductase alpha chain